MFVYLLATLCLGGTCRDVVVASSENDSLLTMTSCQMTSQAAIAEWMMRSQYRDWSLSRYACVVGERRSTT